MRETGHHEIPVDGPMGQVRADGRAAGIGSTGRGLALPHGHRLGVPRRGILFSGITYADATSSPLRRNARVSERTSANRAEVDHLLLVGTGPETRSRLQVHAPESRRRSYGRAGPQGPTRNAATSSHECQARWRPPRPGVVASLTETSPRSYSRRRGRRRTPASRSRSRASPPRSRPRSPCGGRPGSRGVRRGTGS
jgi:hypothetical protein